MMSVKVIAVLCALANPTNCHEETVTTSEMSGVSGMGCQMGMVALSEFMRERPQYRLAKWKCQMGDRPNAA